MRYQSVAADVREELTGGDYRPGQLLPSEADLAAAHDVSRVTIRRALAKLKDDGLVDSRRGYGWYAVAVPLRQTLGALTTIEAQVAASGRTPRRRVLSFAFVAAPARVATTLGVETVLEITRLNLADDEPIAVVTVWVPEDMAADLSRRSVEQHPLYDLLGVRLAGATQVITAVAASPLDAGRLRVPEWSPLLRCERTTHDTAGRAVLVSDALFNPALTQFVADLPALDDAEPTGLRLAR